MCDLPSSAVASLSFMGSEYLFSIVINTFAIVANPVALAVFSWLSIKKFHNFEKVQSSVAANWFLRFG